MGKDFSCRLPPRAETPLDLNMRLFPHAASERSYP
jgi:hypothetical protein